MALLALFGSLHRTGLLAGVDLFLVAALAIVMHGVFQLGRLVYDLLRIVTGGAGLGKILTIEGVVALGAVPDPLRVLRVLEGDRAQLGVEGEDLFALGNLRGQHDDTGQGE